MSVKCNILSKKIWGLCNENGCWISAEHVPGSHNTVADYMSRALNSLHFCFKVYYRDFSLFQTDLFASYLNKQLSNYISWHPNPESVGVDAFNMSWTKLKFYAFPPFSLVAKSISKIIQVKASGIMVIPRFYPYLFPDNDVVARGLPYHSPAEESHVDTTAPREQVTSTVPQTPASSHMFIRKTMGNRDLQEEVMGIICLSWRDKTTPQYELVLRQWKNYCSQKGVDPLFTDVKNVLDFFHGMYKRGCRYSGICAARSALSSAVTIPGYKRMSNHPLISRYVRGIYNKHPPLPKCVIIWDMNKLLTYYDNMGSNSELTFKQLCRKIAVLLMLLGARRKQALLAIDIGNVIVQTDKANLLPNKTLKHKTPKHPLKPFVYHSFSENENLCIVN